MYTLRLIILIIRLSQLYQIIFIKLKNYANFRLFKLNICFHTSLHPCRFSSLQNPSYSALSGHFSFPCPCCLPPFHCPSYAPCPTFWSTSYSILLEMKINILITQTKISIVFQFNKNYLIKNNNYILLIKWKAKKNKSR